MKKYSHNHLIYNDLRSYRVKPGGGVYSLKNYRRWHGQENLHRNYIFRAEVSSARCACCSSEKFKNAVKNTFLIYLLPTTYEKIKITKKTVKTGVYIL